MNVVVRALEERLESSGFPVHVVDATGTNDQVFFLLLPGGGAPSPEHNLAGDRTPIRDTFMVRAVAGSADAALTLLSRGRVVLSNAGRPLTFDADTWRITLTRAGSLPVTVDRDVRMASTNSFPVFVTDEYTYDAVPLGSA